MKKLLAAALLALLALGAEVAHAASPWIVNQTSATANVPVTFNQPVTFSSSTAITGSSAFTTLTVSTISTTVDAVRVSTHQYISGNATVGGTLGVTGASTLTGNTAVTGTLGVTGATTVSTVTASQTATFNGPTVIGDASGDTVTSNADAWTFPNDTAVTLTGGVNGLNLDSNTLSIDASNNRVAIGNAAPATDLHIQSAADAILRIQKTSVRTWDIKNDGGWQVMDIEGGRTPLYLDNGGTVRINNTSALTSGQFQVTAADNGTTIGVKISTIQASVTTADVFMAMYSDTGLEGSIAGTAVAGVIAFNTFTAGHWTQIVGFRPELLAPLCSNGEVTEGLNKEQLVKSVRCGPQDPGILGFFAGQDAPGEKATALALGTGFAWVLNTGADIKIGDWLVTSGDGLTLKQQADDLQHNYSAAKASQFIRWKNGEKKRKIAVTYHAG